MKNKFLIYTIVITIIWMGIIYFFSAMPATTSHSGSKGLIRYVVKIVYRDESDKEITRKVNKLNYPVRKTAHVLEYLILTVLINSIFYNFFKDMLYCNLISSCISFFYACTDEIHQLFSLNRTALFSDVLVDSIGIVFGCLLFNYLYKKLVKKVYN